MSFQPGANLYTAGFGTRPENVEVPHIEIRDPSTTDVNYPIGKKWLNTSTQHEFVLYKFNSLNGITVAVWGTPVGATGAVLSLQDQFGTKSFPDTSGSVAVDGTAFEIVSTTNPGTHSVVFSFPNSVVMPGDFTATAGVVNLGTVGNNNVNIGNSSSSLSQLINIDTGGQINIGLGGVASISVGKSDGQPTTVFCPTNFLNEVNIQGSLIAPEQGLGIINGTFSQSTSINLTSGVFNCSGAEGILLCAPSGAITINLSGNAFPGSYVTIYDSIGTASVNNITINAPGGGMLFQSGLAPAVSYVINSNYGNVVLYFIPPGSTPNYIIFNH